MVGGGESAEEPKWSGFAKTVGVVVVVALFSLWLGVEDIYIVQCRRSVEYTHLLYCREGLVNRRRRLETRDQPPHRGTVTVVFVS